MENTMGTLTDSKDGKARSDMTLSSVNDTAATEDRIPGTETPHGESPTTSNAGKYSYNITVKGSENSTVGENISTGVFNYTVNNNEKEQEGLACDVTKGEKPKLKISVPAEDGGTMIHVDCTNGKVRHWSYCRNVDIEKTFGSRWTFGNIFDGFMAAIISGKIGDDFFDLIGKWMESYGCKVYKVYKKCLVIEFLHETEEGRDRMIEEKETVKQMFQTFIESINPNASSCTLEDVSKDVSVPSTSKSEQAQAQGMMPREYKKEKQFKSVSDDERERLPKKEKEYSADETETSSPFDRLRRRVLRRPDVVETSSSFDSPSIERDELETSSSFDRSRMSFFELLSNIMVSNIMVSNITDVEREPIPVSQVHLHNCGRCSEVLQNCENELSALPNLHFIHFNPNFRKTSKLQFTKILSALRNSGGVLLVHHHYPTGSGLDSLNRFINQISDSVLTRDVVTCVTCEVFKTQRIRNYEDMFRIDVQPSEMYVTHDYKTKFPSLSTGKFENASNERIRHLLFSSRTTESTEAAFKGISSRQQNVEDLRLRYSRPTPMLRGPSEPPRHMLNVLVDDIDVDDIMTSHSVPEHITSLSKKKSGGSMFVVMAGLTFDDTPLRQQERFKACLMQTLKKNLRVQKNKHSKVSLQDIDVFKIGLSKDADSGDCILEIAVGHVNGCVFYDSQGPESYKIEGEKIVRLPIERWVEEAFE